MQYIIQRVGKGMKKLAVVTLIVLTLADVAAVNAPSEKSQEESAMANMQMIDGGPPM